MVTEEIIEMYVPLQSTHAIATLVTNNRCMRGVCLPTRVCVCVCVCVSVCLTITITIIRMRLFNRHPPVELKQPVFNKKACTHSRDGHIAAKPASCCLSFKQCTCMPEGLARKYTVHASPSL